MELPEEQDVVTRDASDGNLDFLIVDAVAEVTGQKPMNVPPLYESVDLDSLVAIVQSHDGDIHAKFEHAGCTVRVAGGAITVATA